MPRFRVDTYTAEWNPKTNIGKVTVTIQGRQFPLPIDNVDEFTTTLLLLSKPGVLCDTTDGTQWELELPFRPSGT